MNRMLLAFGVVALLMFAQVAHAQTSQLATAKADTKVNDTRPAFGTTRVAVINLGYVFTTCERSKAFKREMEGKVKNAAEEAKVLAGNIKTWQAAVQQGNLSDTKKAQYEEKIITARRRLEDLDRTMRAKVGKLQSDNLQVLWKDIRDAVKSFSKEHDIDLVLMYGEPGNEALDQLPNINRKMHAVDIGSSAPFFVNPRADISEAIVEMLNQRFEKERVAEDGQ
ncbi:MAG TPA: OmpH family outer membrane protein [Gemmataceae bacterium]|nr:OmpH family outer membrane protein [Gemmataceae bacterium]